LHEGRQDNRSMTQVFGIDGRAGRLGGRGRALRQRLLALAGGLLLCACSPALDWRQLHPEGWGLSVALPCRPASHARQVPLAGAPVQLTLLACSVDGHTFAVASADLGDPARVGPALQALAAAALANVDGTLEGEQPAAVPGMTPHPGARRLQMSGRLPDGSAVREQVLVFALGMRVFQASVVGPQADDPRVRPFFDSIVVPR
jgi:hypothetical protein